MARSRYQTIFTISADDKQGLGLLEDACAFICSGVSEQFGEPDIASSTEGEWKNDQGKLRIDSEVREGAGFFSLLWERLDGWHLRWRLATLKGEVEADVQVSGPDRDPRPAGPPGALEEVLKRYTCRIQGYDMWDLVQGISKENADWYADSVIFNPRRRIPIVAISPAGILEGSARFQRAHMLLRGIAAVAVPSAHDLSVINAKLGRMACSGGEVRVYQPGATREDDPSLHRKWRPNEVDWGDIRDECMHILALSQGPRIYHEVREEIVRLWEEDQPEENLGDLSSSAQIRGLQSVLAEERDAKSRAEAERDHWQEKHGVLERDSRREIERLTKGSQSATESINELLGQIYSRSPTETLIPQLQEQIAQLQSERDAYWQELDRREDQSEDVARLTREHSEARQENTELREKAEAAIAPNKRGRRRTSAGNRAEIARLEEDKENLELALASKDRRISQLEDRVSKQDEELEQHRQIPEYSEAIEEESPPEPPYQPKSVSEVVLNAQKLPGLRFLNTAFSSANDSPYKHLDRLDRALNGLSEYANIIGAGQSLHTTPEEWFQERSLDYVPHEGLQTTQKHRRDFTDDLCRTDITMLEHIRLGKGGNRDPKDILRIHFAWCKRENLLLVGHVGRHLR